MTTPALPIPTVFPPEAFEEIAALTKEFGKVSKDFITAPKKLDTAVNLIAMARSMVTETEKWAKATTESIMEPVAERLQALKTERASIMQRAEKIAKEIEKGLHMLIDSGDLTEDGMLTKAGTRLSLVKRDSAQIVDADAIPDEFLLPRAQCIDMAKVEAVLKAEAASAALMPESSATPPSSVPGARLARSYTFRTKLPEEVA